MATPVAAPGGAVPAGENRRFKNQLKKVYTWYTGGFILFVIVARNRRADGPAA